MLCLNCGADIPQNVRVCPYCDMSVEKGLQNRAADDKILNNRYAQIDSEFGLNTEYEMLPTDKLKAFLEATEAKFDLYRESQVLNAEQIDKIFSRISKMEETLQSKFPVRKEVRRSGDALNGKSTAQRVNICIYKITPPDVNTAAYVLRSAIERKLRDFYRFPYINDATNREAHFVKSYYDMFNEIIGNSEIADKCRKCRGILNLFIHQSEDNDKLIKRKFPRTEDRVNFIKKALNLFSKYNLI